ncbi:nicotinate-nucleotide adenylyltransferase [Flavobacteriaceae bacterium SZ-1-7]|uniref:nicotinate-nucleotide adenylyltransferase n=1 Tax=Tamlana sedimenti TaxID=3134126 RepID=UPI003127EB2A
MKNIFLAVMTLVFVVKAYPQTVNLPETIITINSDYLNAVNTNHSNDYVAKLEQAILNYNHSDISQLYDDKNDIYNVSFKLPDGEIVVSFNKDGKIIKTFEKYKNMRLPLGVMKTIAEKYPGHGIIEGVYLIKYHSQKEMLQQEYKIKLKNNDSILTVKINEKGEFL